MVWVFRVVLGLVILAYAGWQVWPLAAPLSDGASIVQTLASLEGAGDLGAFGMASVFLGMIALYAAAGGLTVAAQSWAPRAYFLAMAAEIFLRLQVVLRGSGAGPLDLAARVDVALGPLNLGIDPRPLSIALLLVVGLLVLAQDAWRGQSGKALTHDWLRSPVYD